MTKCSCSRTIGGQCNPQPATRWVFLCTLLASLSTLTLVSGNLAAFPPPQGCLQANGEPFSVTEDGNPAHVVHIFVDDGMAADLSSGTDTNLDDGLTNRQVAEAFMQAAEIWNATTRAIGFVFDGFIDTEQPHDLCDQTTELVKELSSVRSDFQTECTEVYELGRAHVKTLDDSSYDTFVHTPQFPERCSP